MSDKQLDIRVAIETEEPDIRVGLERIEPDLQVEIRTGGIAYPPYEGDTIIKPRAHYMQVLETENTVLKSNITVLEIPYSSVSNLKNGRTVHIG